jgi:hypothetical protein
VTIAVVQSAAYGNSGGGVGATINLPAPATAGRLIAIVLGFRNSLASTYVITGFTRAHYDHTAPATLDSDAIGVYARIAAGGEQNIALPASGSPASGVIAEVSGFSPVLAGVDLAGANLAAAIAAYPALAPARPGAPGFLVRADWKKAASPNPGPMTLTGWALLGDSGYNGFGNRHRLTVFYATAAALAASYPSAARSSSDAGGDTGVVVTAAAFGLAPGGFPPRIW